MTPDPKKITPKREKEKCRVNPCMKRDYPEKLVDGFCSSCMDKLRKGKTINIKGNNYGRSKSKIKSESMNRYSTALRNAKAEFQLLRRVQEANGFGIVECVGGKFRRWNDCDGGHYIPAYRMNTCFAKMNIHPQLKADNKRMSMSDPLASQEYRAWLVKRFGEIAVARLEAMAMLPKKYDAFELEAMAKEFKRESTEIIKSKKLK